MFQTGFSVHHQEHKTAHTASGICQTNSAARLAAGSTLPKKVSKRHHVPSSSVVVPLHELSSIGDPFCAGI